VDANKETKEKGGATMLEQVELSGVS